MSATHFPDDHFVEILRGDAKLPSNHVKRTLAKMAARIAIRAEAAIREGRREQAVGLLQNLRAIVQAMEVFEQVHARVQYEGRKE